MLATLVIGLREGLEAALIVGIIAAFLRKNGKSLVPMWLGVALAVILSLVVGISLNLVEQALPQAAQEGMEAIIGVVAIFFVTGMIAWMNAHARDMKRRLEADAAEALGRTGTYALASMAFLAVLREGFETSVFLLATFSAAQSTLLAAAGAIIGLLIAVGIGWAIYAGGVKIHLGRFFRLTSGFLILVAAGLVITSLRTAHEAGWLNAGQQPVADLAWLVAPGSVQSALITGVLGIPADPRLIEAIGWLAYLVPVALFIYWPLSRRPGPRAAAHLRYAVAAVLGLLALGLAVLYPGSRTESLQAAIVAADSSAAPSSLGTIRLTVRDDGELALEVLHQGGDSTVMSLPASEAHHQRHDGRDVMAWSVNENRVPAGVPSSLALDRLVTLSGGRLPVGFSPVRHPGPFDAAWSIHRSTTVWVAEGILLDARQRSTTAITLSGGGLQTPRTVTVDDDNAADDWQMSAADRDRAVVRLDAKAAAGMERQFWSRELPLALTVFAFVLVLSAGRRLIRLRQAPRRAANRSSTTAAVSHKL